MNQQIGHCKHGEFNLLDGCPKCIEERRAANQGGAIMGKLELFEGEDGKVEGELSINPELKQPIPEGVELTSIVKVRYCSETTGELSKREYSYFTEEPLAVNNVVKVPIRNTATKAVVTAVNVPEVEILAFKDQVKTIPSGSKTADVFEALALPEGAIPDIQQGELIGYSTQAEEPTTAGYFGKYGVFTDRPGEETVKSSRTFEPAEAVEPGGNQTAMIRVEPGKDLRIVQLYEEGVKLWEVADKRFIETNADLKPAVDDLAIIAKLKKALEEKKKEYVAPIREHLDAVNQAFVAFLEPFDKADKITRCQISDFRAFQEERAAEAKRIEDEKLRLAREEATFKGTGEITVELGTAEAPPPVPARTRTDLGTQGFAKVHKWEVVDFSKVPDQYKIPNAAMITGVVKGSKGAIEIPGIRIWTEESVRINTK